MKAVRYLAIALVVYAGIVAAFESLLGVLQPNAGGETIVITTVDEDGGAHDRVVTRLTSGDKLYVAANHWPRAWFHRAIENPEVRATIDGETKDYLAVPVEGAEHEQVDGENALPLPFRIVTGFPPRYFVRLDPR